MAQSALRCVTPQSGVTRATGKARFSPYLVNLYHRSAVVHSMALCAE